jgi:anti-sigma factor ChrR (cupin superfamily)
MTELVTEYVEGDLSWGQWVRFQMHVGICVDCRRYLKQMQDTIAVAGQLPETPLDPDAHAVLLERFRDWKADRS